MSDRYSALYGAFRWQVPADFNIAHWTCRRWAADPQRVALHWEDESGARATWTYRDLQQGGDAREGGAAIRARAHRSARRGRHHLHQRHHGSAEGRIAAALRAPRQPPRLRAFARWLSARGRSLLVARRLGMDGRALGRIDA